MLFRFTLVATLALSFAPALVSAGTSKTPESPDDSSEGSSDGPSHDMCTFDILSLLIGPDCFDLEAGLPGTTVFGPCDFAFEEFFNALDLVPEEVCAELIAGTLDELLEEELLGILLYHVVDDTILLMDAVEAKKQLNDPEEILVLKTLQGQNIVVNTVELTVNDVPIVLLAETVPFVLYGIAGVLIPPPDVGKGGKGKGEGKSGKSKGKGGTDAPVAAPTKPTPGGKNGKSKGKGKGGTDAPVASPVAAPVAAPTKPTPGGKNGKSKGKGGGYYGA